VLIELLSERKWPLSTTPRREKRFAAGFVPHQRPPAPQRPGRALRAGSIPSHALHGDAHLGVPAADRHRGSVRRRVIVFTSPVPSRAPSDRAHLVPDGRRVRRRLRASAARAQGRKTLIRKTGLVATATLLGAKTSPVPDGSAVDVRWRIDGNGAPTRRRSSSHLHARRQRRHVRRPRRPVRKEHVVLAGDDGVVAAKPRRRPRRLPTDDVDRQPGRKPNVHLNLNRRRGAVSATVHQRYDGELSFDRFRRLCVFSSKLKTV